MELSGGVGGVVKLLSITRLHSVLRSAERIDKQRKKETNGRYLLLLSLLASKNNLPWMG